MNLKEIIELKLRRLESVPDAFISSLDKTEIDYFKKVLLLIEGLERQSGNFVLNKENIARLAAIEAELKSLFLSTDYVFLVNNFIQEITKQSELTDSYFKKTFKLKAAPEEAALVLAKTKKDAAELLLSTPLDNNFIAGIRQQVDMAVTSQASYSDTIKTLQTIITGNAETDSKIMRYAKQVTHDAFSLSDGAYTKVVGDYLGAEWYFYSGNKIATSRQFCIERHNKYYHKKEVEAWAALGDWAGRMAGTNKETIFVTKGGHECRHGLLPVSIAQVPRDVVERNISNGNYKT